MTLDRGTCRSCGAEILWVRSARSGKPMPLNPGRKVVVTERGEVHNGYEPHWSSCPYAEQHRAPRQQPEDQR